MRMTNLFNLLSDMLQFVPQIGNLDDTLSITIPLAAIVGLSVAKEGYMDIKRWLADKKANSRKYLKYVTSKLDETQEVESQHIRVGDILEIQDD